MKSIRYSLVIMVLAAIVVAVPALAQTMTDEHVDRIKQNCGLALSTIGIIHANDAPIYINRNQTYFSISDKMMARLNSRLALNRYDATELVKTASEFNKALVQFRSAYKIYDDTMAELVRMDCSHAPVSFYDKVADAREQRQKVHDIVLMMQKLLVQYRDNVMKFKNDTLTKSQEGANG